MSPDTRSADSRPARPTGGPLRIALAQVAPVLGDRQRNLALHLARIEEARGLKADLTVFPELSLTGYFLRDIVPDVALRRDAAEIEELLAAAGPMAVAAGFVEESAPHHFYNAAFFGEQGRLLHVHRKVYLPTYGLFEEQRYFAGGRRIRAFDSPRFGRVGLLICEDLWHVSAATIMQAEEIDLLIWAVNSPARGVEGAKVRTAEVYAGLVQSFALLLGAVVVLVNRVGFEDGLCFWGGSMAAGPDGRILAEGPQFDEALVDLVFDPAELRRERLITPLGRDEQLLLTIEELARIKRRRYDD